MTEHSKIEKHHLERDAYLYVRQSSMRQVVENTESTKRQYALRQRAIALGWKAEQVVVIDSDQGESAASAVWREGFQRLVTEVGMGRAGIVMGIEVSRLARNSADWHRLLEICALSQTLILDEDGVYNPTCYNDRMLLGLKGTMSEAELHVLKARLRGGILNKARRGEFRCPLPVGLIYDEAGNVVLDPDLQVREAIEYFFKTFARERSAHQTVKVFRKAKLLFPSRHKRNGDDQLVFKKLTSSTAIRTLHNPRYAGTYAFGRRTHRKTINGTQIKDKASVDDWTACIPNAHPGYISWEQYQENLQILKKNAKGYQLARESIPREGHALLQGKAICGICGCKMRVRYADRRGRNEAWYICDRAGSAHSAPQCQSIAGNGADKAVGELVAKKVTPAAVELALAVREEIEKRHDEADQLRLRTVERAQTETNLAERRYMMVDPDNRLVADSLEADWNNKLRILAEARKERERQKQQNLLHMDKTIRKRLFEMTENFKKLWTAPATPNRERKRMLAHIIEDVTLVKSNSLHKTKVHVRFKGGKTETLTVDNPKSSAEKIKTPPETVQLVDELLNDYTYVEIADHLNELGKKPGSSALRGNEKLIFKSKHVAYIKNAYKLKSRHDRLRERGMLSATELAEKLKIHPHTLKTWGKHGLVKKHAYNGHAYLYEIPGPELPPKKHSRWDTVADRVDIMHKKLTKNKDYTL